MKSSSLRFSRASCRWSDRALPRRILIGEDAKMIDAAVRAKPEASYDYAELFAGLIGSGGDQAS